MDAGHWEERLSHIMEMDARLAAIPGWRPMDPTWARVIGGAYLAHPDVVIGRKGRRAGGTSTWLRVAVAECTAGTWTIPPDDVGVYTLMSADLPQAKRRIRSCVEICRALDIAHESTTTEIRFPDARTAIMAKAANVRNAVSDTNIGALLDEMALWQDDQGSNPATEILAMMMPAFGTQPGAFPMLLSAPWTTGDPHAKEYDDVGPGRHRFHVRTWEGNPTMSEDYCRRISKTDAEFKRQYAAEPLDGAGMFAFPPSIIRRAMGIAEVAA